MGDDDRLFRVDGSRANMIGMRVAVDDMRNRLIGDFGNGVQDIRTDTGRGIYYDDTFTSRQEYGLIRAVGDPI